MKTLVSSILHGSRPNMRFILLSDIGYTHTRLNLYMYACMYLTVYIWTCVRFLRAFNHLMCGSFGWLFPFRGKGYATMLSKGLTGSIAKNLIDFFVRTKITHTTANVENFCVMRNKRILEQVNKMQSSANNKVRQQNVYK